MITREHLRIMYRTSIPLYFLCVCKRSLQKRLFSRIVLVHDYIVGRYRESGNVSYFRTCSRSSGAACRSSGAACRSSGTTCRSSGAACRSSDATCRSSGATCRSSGATCRWRDDIGDVRRVRLASPASRARWLPGVSLALVPRLGGLARAGSPAHRRLARAGSSARCRALSTSAEQLVISARRLALAAVRLAC